MSALTEAEHTRLGAGARLDALVTERSHLVPSADDRAADVLAAVLGTSVDKSGDPSQKTAL